MKIVVTADGAGLDAPASRVFGRCETYVFVDTDSMEAETVENPAIGTASGAGIQAAQFVAERGPDAVVTGNVGPNAYSVLEAANVPVYLLEDGTVREVVQAYKDGRLRQAGGSTGPAHAGMGRGRGMGRGMGMGMGRGMSGRSVPRQEPSPRQPATEPQTSSGPSRQEEISDLKEMASELRGQLAAILDRLDQLEEGE